MSERDEAAIDVARDLVRDAGDADRLYIGTTTLAVLLDRLDADAAAQAEGAREEREACARLCDERAAAHRRVEREETAWTRAKEAMKIARLIRARGEEKPGV